MIESYRTQTNQCQKRCVAIPDFHLTRSMRSAHLLFNSGFFSSNLKMNSKLEISSFEKKGATAQIFKQTKMQEKIASRDRHGLL